MEPGSLDSPQGDWTSDYSFAEWEASDESLPTLSVNNEDRAAFTVLLMRHEEMVPHACRYVLYHWHDAEGAFQRAILVLMSKADSFRKGALGHPDGGNRAGHPAD